MKINNHKQFLSFELFRMLNNLFQLIYVHFIQLFISFIHDKIPVDETLSYKTLSLI